MLLIVWSFTHHQSPWAQAAIPALCLLPLSDLTAPKQKEKVFLVIGGWTPPPPVSSVPQHTASDGTHSRGSEVDANTREEILEAKQHHNASSMAGESD